MQSYLHKNIFNQISGLSNAPDDDSSYEKWLCATDHLNLMRDNFCQDELIIYASANSVFVHSVLVPNNNLYPEIDSDDLLRWSCNPYDEVVSFAWSLNRDDLWTERRLRCAGAVALNDGTPLIFGRSFEGWKGNNRNYLELLQEYSHLSDIHWRPEHKGYCRFDDNGDVINFVSLTKCQETKISLVTFLRQPLENYLVANQCSLIRLFDFTMFRPNSFPGWSDSEDSTVVEDSNFFYRQRIDNGQASYVRGVQIIRPERSPKEIILSFGHPQKQTKYVEFTAIDWRNRKVTEISTNPRQTTNYFETDSNSLPFELSPAFFRPEVLSKYKADSDKYTIRDRTILCRAAWSLRYDVNEENQIHAYICDLRHLPYQEQLHWKSHNEKPKIGISERAFENDFLGKPSENIPPLSTILNMLEGWRCARVGWWKLRSPKLIEKVNVPYTGSRDEWSRAFVEFSKLVIEGFNVNFLRIALKEKGLSYQTNEKSLSLIEKYLSMDGGNEGEQIKLEGLRTAQQIRSKIDVHVPGTDAERLSSNALTLHGSFTAHFNFVCDQIIGELQQIEISYSTVTNVKE